MFSDLQERQFFTSHAAADEKGAARSSSWAALIVVFWFSSGDFFMLRPHRCRCTLLPLCYVQFRLSLHTFLLLFSHKAVSVALIGAPHKTQANESRAIRQIDVSLTSVLRSQSIPPRICASPGFRV